MNDSNHTHRLSIFWWLGWLMMGLCIFFMAFITITLNTQELLSGKMSMIETLEFLLLVPCMFQVSVFFVMSAFITRIVVKASGLEYHTPVYVMETSWKDLTNKGFAHIDYIGKTLVVIPKQGNLTIRKWARPLRRWLKKNVQDVPIYVSQFRNCDRHSLEEDIRVNIAQNSSINEFPTQ